MGAAKAYAYSWPGVDGTIEAPSEAQARALIRAKHQLKWVPNGAKVVRLDGTTYERPSEKTPQISDTVSINTKPEVVAAESVAPVYVAPFDDEVTTYPRLTDEGKARLLKPHWWKTNTIHGYGKPSPARPRRDKDAVAYLARLQKAMPPVGKYDLKGYERYLGRSAGDGFVILATDGHRMICQKGSPTKTETSPLTELAALTPDHRWFQITDGVTLALQRMQAVGGKGAALLMAIDPKRKRLLISAKDVECEAREWVPIEGELAGTVLKFNVSYVLDGLGLTGQRVYYRPRTQDPLVVDTYGDLRYVVQPLGASTRGERWPRF